MKKIFGVLLASFVALGVCGKAQASARLDSMAADARQVGDIDLIWDYPNLVADYADTVDFRLAPNGVFGDGTNEWGGVLSQVDPSFGVLGVYVNRPAGEYSWAFSGLWEVPVLSLIPLDQHPVGGLGLSYNNSVDLFWGKKLSAGDLGAHFSYSGVNEGPGELLEVYSVEAGLGLDHVGPFDALNLHAGFGSADISGNGITSHGIYSYKVGGLGSTDFDADDTLRVFSDLEFDNFKVDSTITGEEELDDWGMELGSSFNRKIDGGKGLLSTGLILGYESLHINEFVEDLNFKDWDILWNTSLEAPVADWLTLRAGVAKLVLSRVYNPQDFLDGVYFDNAFVGHNVHFSVGFGLNWQNFTLNASVIAGSLENSISGTQPGQGIFYAGDIVTAESADLQYKF